jgi:hypothetical protein
MQRHAMKLALAAASIAMPTGGSAQFVVRVVDQDRESPVPSTISVRAEEIWVEAGRTDENGVFRFNSRCDGSRPVRAEPLNRAYYPSAPVLCSTRLVIRVRQRNEPYRDDALDYDADNDSQLDRVEFVNFLSSTNVVERVSEINPQEAALWIPALDYPIEVRAGYTERYDTSIYRLIGMPAIQGSSTYSLALASERVGEIFAASESTLRAFENSDEELQRYLVRLLAETRARNDPGSSPLVKALNQTSLSFSQIDQNGDGHLSQDELGSLQLSERHPERNP